MQYKENIQITNLQNHTKLQPPLNYQKNRNEYNCAKLRVQKYEMIKFEKKRGIIQCCDVSQSNVSHQH